MGSNPDRVKPNTVKFVFAAYPLSTQHVRRKSKDWLTRTQDNVSADYCLSELYSTIKIELGACVGLVQSGSHHHLIEN